MELKSNRVYMCVCGLRVRLLCSPLKRMTVGMFFAALAFVAAALVQIQVDVRPHETPPTLGKLRHARPHEAQFHTHNSAPLPANPAQVPIEH